LKSGEREWGDKKGKIGSKQTHMWGIMWGTIHIDDN